MAEAWRAACSLREPPLRPFAGERLRDATVLPAVPDSVTDSFEFELLDAGDGGSSLSDSLQR